jgi:predicted Zn-dependent protease
VDHVASLLTNSQPADRTLLACAYLTEAAALFKLGQLDAADHRLADAAAVNSVNSAIYELWSEVKRAQGDLPESARLRARSRQVAGLEESYAEVAALQFGLTFTPGQSLIEIRRSATRIRYN